MDLGFIYELINKENIFIFIAGFMAGFGAGSALMRSGKKQVRYESKQRGCFYAAQKWGYITIYLFYKNGKLVNIGCPYKQKRLCQAPYCSLLDSTCKELE